MKIARIFQLLAVILLGIAAYFLWLGNRDGVFVSLVLSGCAYFLNMRFQIRERIAPQLEARKAAAEETPEEAEESETEMPEETKQ